MSSGRWRFRFSLLSRLLLGAVFLTAGVSKVFSPEDFSRAIDNYRLLAPRFSYLVALWLPWQEIVVGCLFILNRWSRAAAALALMMEIVFAGAIGSALYRGLDISCGCFSGTARVSWLHLALDLLLMAITVVYLRFGEAGPGPEGPNLDSKSAAQRPVSKALIGTLILSLLFNLVYLIGQSPLVDTVQDEQAISSLRLEVTSLDLGKVTQGKVAQGAVRIINDGESPVLIEHVEASCGCTEAFLSSNEIPPHQSGTLLVGFDAGSKSGPSTEVVKLAVQGVQEPLVLEVKADVQPLFQFDPPAVQLEVGTPTRVMLRSLQPDVPVEIANLTVPTKEIEISIVGKPDPGSVELEIRLSKELPMPPAPAEAWVIGAETTQMGLPPLSLYVIPGGKAR